MAEGAGRNGATPRAMPYRFGKYRSSVGRKKNCRKARGWQVAVKQIDSDTRRRDAGTGIESKFRLKWSKRVGCRFPATDRSLFGNRSCSGKRIWLGKLHSALRLTSLSENGESHPVLYALSQPSEKSSGPGSIRGRNGAAVNKPKTRRCVRCCPRVGRAG